MSGMLDCDDVQQVSTKVDTYQSGGGRGDAGHVSTKVDTYQSRR